MITVLKSYRLQGVSVVVNMLRGDLLLSGECLSPKEVQELLRVPILGVVPDTYAILEGDLSLSHAAFRVLANNLLTDKRRLYDVTKKYSGFWGNVRRVLKRKL